MKLNKKVNIILACVLFLICLGIGFRQAYYKPLWNDEIYTLVSSVNGLSYTDMLLGRVQEGNNCPLFYLVQRGICDIAQYRVPSQWVNGNWGFIDVGSQVLLRINPVIFMALSIVMIFYYFSRYYSLWAGVYSVVVSFSSFMIWVYWAEARPYALVVFLTALQSLVFMKMMKEGDKYRGGWIKLTVVHFLLSLTGVLSIIQIAVVSALLWITLERDWRKYISLLVIPAFICITYYSLSPKYQFWFADGPLALINANISKDRLLIFSIFAIYLCLVYIQPKVGFLKNIPINVMDEKVKKEVGVYFWSMVLIIAGYFLILLKFKFGSNLDRSGFQISNRYFICLTPIGIIATTLFSIYLIRCSRNKVVQGFMLLLLGGLLLIRILRTIQII